MVTTSAPQGVRSAGRDRVRRLPRAVPLVAALTVLATALAACGGGSSVHSSSSTTTTPSTAAPTSTGTTAPAGLARCATTQLHVSFGAVGAAAGNRYVRLILTNSGAPCRAQGFVGMQLLGPGSQPVPTNVVRDLSVPSTPVTVATGGQTSARLHWGAIPGGSEPQSGPCEAVPQQVEVTPPNELHFDVTSWTFGSVCEQGRIDTGPLQSGVPSD
jgi:Protein of unknown function (DUF4232)